MSRAARLLDLMQALRRRRAPVSGAVLAGELGVSLRTLYRDIATLTAQGAPISGEAGLGYVLKPGFDLPPLMFPAEEVEAVVLGLRLVAQKGDPALTRAAENAAARIRAVLPAGLREDAEATPLLAGPNGVTRRGPPRPVVDVAVLRAALRTRRKLALAYRDLSGQASRRVVWPVALAFFENALVLAAWCELREDFRHFRVDRIETADTLEALVPERRAALLKRWREQEGVAAQL
ncbi:YafY family transcriptional regulator [Alsobacter sp. SYSU M60028]|uniref:YafY family transcriptional regulator n=1 Tax=Alsobacter ponti TaxID=2962936 RepID=A0ABT1LBZ9_9HYPH|nr:YafY family protein [Alsobacter ponti]MCP8939030.1 YafY family transcriptional regulator [Alsobacter ponti]